MNNTLFNPLIHVALQQFFIELEKDLTKDTLA